MPEEGKFVRVVNEHGITWKYDINGRLVEKLVDKGGYRPLFSGAIAGMHEVS